MIDLGGRVVIVTGAGGGLGRSHARLLGARGARVVVNDLGGAVDGTGDGFRPADAVVEEITAAGGEAIANYDTVATPEGGASMVRQTVEAFGALDAVVHNAGILRDKSISKLEPADLDAVIDVHLKGGFNLVRPAWEHLCSSGTGRVVVTSSASGLLGNFGQSNYGAAKMGLVGMMNVLAVEGKRQNVKINTVAPGARTRMTEGLLGELSEILDPELVSPIVAYLVSAECEVTGEIYGAAAGRFSRYFVGATLGWDAGREAPASVEDIAEHLDRIRSEEDYFVPASAADELKILNQLRSR